MFYIYYRFIVQKLHCHLIVSWFRILLTGCICVWKQSTYCISCHTSLIFCWEFFNMHSLVSVYSSSYYNGKFVLYLGNILTISHSHVFWCLQTQPTSICSQLAFWRYNLYATLHCLYKFACLGTIVQFFSYLKFLLVIPGIIIIILFYSTTISALCRATGTWHQIRK